eukprot:TRINITY_DN388_c0_g1_i3.p1 TRINITY_DN388_c0_g1~~TRINITY_DN388_c0_g1_i3.p1  ORF type:complete len:1048 (-),score=249.19 TRINITY_DN388_c0_g1_i3:46-2994(-)
MTYLPTKSMTRMQDFASARARDVQAMSDKLSEDNVKYVNSHKYFVSNLTLALAVAFYTALFALPTYGISSYYFVFGQSPTNYIANPKNYTGEVPFCDSWMVGKFTNVAEEGDAPQLVRHDENNPLLPAWDDTQPESVWCGYFPNMVHDYWGNAAQMIIFTVYLNTGTTIQLGWQGMIGTLLAVMNAWGMECLYDFGELATQVYCSEILPCENQTALDQNATLAKTCEDYGDDRLSSAEICRTNPSLEGVVLFMGQQKRTWGTVFLWVDAIGVLALFLFSGAAENTMKFGMSWHIYFMMNLMNPKRVTTHYVDETFIPHFEVDSEYMAVILTSLIGVTLAILATLVPRPLTNISKVDDDSLAVTNAVNDILSDALEYFCGSERSAKRFQIREKIKALNGTVTTIKGNLVASWWETFDIGGFKDRRALLGRMDDHATDINDVMYALKSAILDEDFGGRHKEYVDCVGPALINLKSEASILLNACLTSCQDGSLDEEEREEMEEQMEKVETLQAEVLAGMRRMSTGVNRDMSNEYIFTHSISFWARKVKMLAHQIMDNDSSDDISCKSFCSGMWGGLVSTWSIKENCMDKEKVSFATRNLISITICYVIGVLGGPPASMFGPYEGNMASTLSLLISHFQGSAMQKNLQRLLGVTMGKSLPIIVLTCLSLVSCGVSYRWLLQFITLMLFIFTFCYMYYTSAAFSTVGCLIAGFGTPMLMVTCVASGTDYGFAARYREIGQVIAAIVIQTIVDYMLSDLPPRDMAVRLTTEMSDGLREGFEAFFESDLAGMKEGYKRASAALAKADAIKDETDPKLMVVRGDKVPFKYDAYLQVLNNMRHLLSDLNVLIVTTTNVGSEARARYEHPDDADSELLRYVNSAQNMSSCRDNFVEIMNASLGTTIAILDHVTEDAVDDVNVSDLKTMRPMRDLRGFSQLFVELDQRPRDTTGSEPTTDLQVRVVVVLRCLRNAKIHLGELTTVVLSNLLH